MIQLSNVQLLRGVNTLLSDASATIYPGHKVGLTGANGCGKSSLFALVRGEISLDQGECNYPNDWKIASVKQETPALEKPAIEYVIDGDVEYRTIQQALIEAEQADNGEKIAHLHHQLDAMNAYSINARAGELLHGLGFTTAQLDQPVKSFSGGWRMRLNLAQALICRSDLLLLDEPTNHLDLDAVFWLERWLKQYPGTLILISHDRDFLDTVVNQIIHIENQTLNSYTGNYTSFERQRIEKLAQQQSMYEKQEKQKAHLQKFVDRFRAKASKAKQAQSRLKALERMEDLAPAHVDSPFQFDFFTPPQLPNPLVYMERMQAGYPTKTILENIKLNLVPGSRIGLLGRNGAGKSTFIKTLAGELKPLGGLYETSNGLAIGYFAQHQLEFLRSDETPLQHMQHLAPDVLEQQLRDHLGRFGFSGDNATSKVAPFSGGEKARLVLAMIVYQKPNLLLLDEPTNHLDLEMRHALAMALQAFEGAMVIVSHDRHLLKTTTDEFYLVADGSVTAFNGDLDDYHQWLTEANKAEAAAISTKPSSEHSAVNRKDKKRKEAEFRQQTKPLRQQVEKLDKQLEKLNQEKHTLELSLSDNALYDDSNKDKLKQLLEQQAKLVITLEETEELWMEASEALELKQQAFDADN
ncbi:ABC transporter ATP-binding protein [Flocculibacter collagenilyticus]|uniref:ABC transporter ATP-binding protein n=1 Tax=Flocculibacter collagenilyticus TaxID=2744479 RepID=UPI0018F28217|nr:ABC transporter ATP-binding protein [Flocculibacter collagenilyticus]